MAGRPAAEPGTGRVVAAAGQRSFFIRTAPQMGGAKLGCDNIRPGTGGIQSCWCYGCQRCLAYDCPYTAGGICRTRGGYHLGNYRHQGAPADQATAQALTLLADLMCWVTEPAPGPARR